jgi:hypothetical protein
MARTHKAERLYQAEVAATHYRRQVLSAIDAICFLGEVPRDALQVRKLADRAATDFNVKVDDIMNEKGRLW